MNTNTHEVVLHDRIHLAEDNFKSFKHTHRAPATTKKVSITLFIIILLTTLEQYIYI
jgi:hypothetical protein